MWGERRREVKKNLDTPQGKRETGRVHDAREEAAAVVPQDWCKNFGKGPDQRNCLG